jgi:hypothetical protein
MIGLSTKVAAAMTMGAQPSTEDAAVHGNLLLHTHPNRKRRARTAAGTVATGDGDARS